MSHIVYLVLGSNLGDRAANLRAAIEFLPPEALALAESSVYETPPWGFRDQPPFLNMAVKVETGLEPLAMLAYLKEIESRVGRAPTFLYGPRLIDLDILFYDTLVMETPALTIPHLHLHERAFVLVPMAELAPDLCHPRLGRTICELLAGVETTGIHLWVGGQV